MLLKFHKTLTGLASLFNTDISTLTQIYCQIYYSRLNSRGKQDAIAFLRQLLVCGERYALHQPIDPVPWTRSSNDGVPLVIKAFKPYLRGTRFQRIFALSVLRSVEILRLPISKDIDSVTNPPVYSDELVRNIINFIPKVSWIKPINLPQIKYHFTMKKGPNGPALQSSDLDVDGLMKSPKLFEAIQTIQEKLNDPYGLDVTFKPRQGCKTLSRLTQFPEKAGKTRTIGVIDYYSQRALKPLHKALMSLLRSLKSDGTYSHRNVGTWAKEKSLERTFLFCADLSAATDRFPAVIQRALLSALIPDNDLSSAFWTLLAEREFTVSWSGEHVKYEAGQPMGAYASWPLFSLAHHLTIEYCYYIVKGNLNSVKHKYRSIGDDFITSSQSQAQQYKKVMEHLGVSINFSKTVESPYRSEMCAAEVAKQLFLNGTNLTPITPGFISDLMKPHMFNMCLSEVRFRYEPMPITPAVLIKKLFRNEQHFQLVWLLASNPYNGCIKPSEEGYDTYSPWAKKDLSGFTSMLVSTKITSLTTKAAMASFLAIAGDPQQDQLPRNDAQLRLEEEILLRLQADIAELQQCLDRGLSIADAIPIEYILDPRDQYKSRKENRCVLESYLLEEILEELPDRD